MPENQHIDEIATAAELIMSGGGTEVRILGTETGTVSGYFDDPVKLATAVAAYDGLTAIYVTLNRIGQVRPSSLANTLVTNAHTATRDTEIEHRQWLLVDADPVRQSNTSSTDAELAAAGALLAQIQSFLADRGWPRPVLALSGNGYHLLYRISLANTDESKDLVKRVLQALDLRFGTEAVKVDCANYNASRVCKLYGTIACKGEASKERPHRRSRLAEVPEPLEAVPEDLLMTLADLVPSKPKGSSRPLNIERWIIDHGLKVASSAAYEGGRKYVLEDCPWNPGHTNRSAFIIQFPGGAIAAGCLHDSCRHHNWQSLRALLEPSKRPVQREDEDEESQVDALLRLAAQARTFRDDLETAYAVVKVDQHEETMKVHSRRFKSWLTRQFFIDKNTAPRTEAVNQALAVLEARGLYDGVEQHLSLRVADHQGSFYYDLGNPAWQTVRVTPEGCAIVSPPVPVFQRQAYSAEQVEPDFGGDVFRLLKHVRLRNPQDGLLLVIYVITCLVANIAHVILLLTGEKGSAKSTTAAMLRSLVDPSKRALMSMPNAMSDLTLALANSYMPTFDNLDVLSPEKSDLLCLTCTGGTISKRKLYSDDEETILRLKRCPVLNGINLVATQPDLLDRSIIAEMSRIPPAERLGEKEVWARFERDRAAIIGGALATLSKAMAIYPSIQLPTLSRMADFTLWGFAIAEALGGRGQEFLSAYASNQDRLNEEVVEAHPVAAAVIQLLSDANEWEGPVAKLLQALEHAAEQARIDTRVRVWPKAPNALSRRLREVQSNLAEHGIHLQVRHAGDFKQIILSKDGPPGNRLYNVLDE